ncbi:MAG: hypothetical protein A2428_03230 [Bdellovibrionales bacterium RIFOXYC1_FULL_54_43]|nr:MAG: hypothetical protein A2428_03230 [Bdellovibrionales bacterium RIFOXYC1_FULL_54_43]
MDDLGVTAEQIAVSAGCCTSTVYKLLRDDPKVKGSIRAKVKRALDKLRAELKPERQLAAG